MILEGFFRKLFGVSEMAKVIRKSSIEAPDEWSSDNFYWRNRKHGLNIWVANDAWGIEVNGVKVKGKSHIFKSYQDWLTRKLEFVYD